MLVIQIVYNKFKNSKERFIMNIIERKHLGNYEIKFKNETAKKLNRA